MFQSFELDEDYDGRKDYLQFNIDVPLLNHEKIQSVQLLFFFDYKLHVRIFTFLPTCIVYEYSGKGLLRVRGVNLGWNAFTVKHILKA